MKLSRITAYILILSAIGVHLQNSFPLYAATIEELQESITQKASQIDALNKEILEIDKKVQATGAESKKTSKSLVLKLT